MDYPAEHNNYLFEHVCDLATSYQQLLGKSLYPAADGTDDFAKRLFHAPFALVSHDTASDPTFNYANLQAMELFELDWQNFTRLPSRLSAEPINQSTRVQLLAKVSQHGYIDDYEGVRISSTGKRFVIKNATVWNVFNPNGTPKGQAAILREWAFL